MTARLFQTQKLAEESLQILSVSSTVSTILTIRFPVVEMYNQKGVCQNAITTATILLEEQGISIWTQAPQATAAICTFGPKFEPFPASNAADVCSVECFPPSLNAFSAAGRVTKSPGHVSTISTKTGTRKYSESPARVVVEICDIALWEHFRV